MDRCVPRQAARPGPGPGAPPHVCVQRCAPTRSVLVELGSRSVCQERGRGCWGRVTATRNGSFPPIPDRAEASLKFSPILNQKPARGAPRRATCSGEPREAPDRTGCSSSPPTRRLLPSARPAKHGRENGLRLEAGKRMEEASPLGLGSRLPHPQHTHPSFDTVSLDTSQTGVGMRTGMTGRARASSKCIIRPGAESVACAETGWSAVL